MSEATSGSSAKPTIQLGECTTNVTVNPRSKETRFCFELGGSSRLLAIKTRKRFDGGGICTSATVSTVEPDGFARHKVFGDFAHTVLRALDERATEKAIHALHGRALAQLDELREDIAAFYAAKGEATASAL